MWKLLGTSKNHEDGLPKVALFSPSIAVRAYSRTTRVSFTASWVDSTEVGASTPKQYEACRILPVKSQWNDGGARLGRFVFSSCWKSYRLLIDWSQVRFLEY